MTRIAIASAKVTESHMPLMPRKIGRISTQTIWKTSVRKKEIVAETNPLFSAVKNAELKILKPQIR